jgi:SAM-dependent methyltransferase
MMQRHGVTPAAVERKADESTRTATSGTGSFISDSTFFGMLGVEVVHAIDHSDYEGANIIVDLNRPISAEYEGFADFIFGGSVLDNVFDPACYMRNITRMLRPGGRLIDVNSSSFGEHPYVLMSPAWYFDYCVINQFASCSLYVSEGGPALARDECHIYGLNLKPDFEAIPDLGDPGSGMRTHVIMVAEKDEVTSWELSPSQDQYRSDKEWQRYRHNLGRMSTSPRPTIKVLQPIPTQTAGYAVRNVRGFRYLGVLDALSTSTPKPPAEQPFLSGDRVPGIRVVEATYGWNQRFTTMSRTANVPLKRGNVTDVLAMAVNGQNECDVEIDVTFLGDPAPGLPKDLTVLYYDAGDSNPHIQTVYIPAEAHGKRLRISATPATRNWLRPLSLFSCRGAAKEGEAS